MSIFFDLTSTQQDTRDNTLLLYALGEELLLKDKHVKNFSRIDTDIIRVELAGFTNAYMALAHMYNMLRQSKNYMAHTCAVTTI